MAYPDITRATATVHEPSDPRHFMRVKPVARTVRIRRRGVLLAESAGALRVIEVGRDVYDPVFYLPRADVRVDLKRIDGKTSHCPLKGEAAYFSLDDGGEAVAWSYESPFDFAAAIDGYIAFYADAVIQEEIGGGA